MCGAAFASVIVGSRRTDSYRSQGGRQSFAKLASSVIEHEFTKYYTSKNTSSEETSLNIVSRSEPKSQ